jgi:hypothetical protein
MKSIFFLRLASILSILLSSLCGCQSQSTESTSPDQITFVTDRISYAPSDTISLSLRNNSADDITTGLKCGLYLEMFYQEKGIQNWSDNLWLPYMSLRCPTDVNTVRARTTFTHAVPAEMFHSTGTFRLIVAVHSQQSDSSLTLVSSVFQIK